MATFSSSISSFWRLSLLNRYFVSARNPQNVVPSVIFYRPRTSKSKAKSKSKKRTSVKTRLGSVAPNGKFLPIMNKKNIHPKLYECLLVNPDGSTYTIRTMYPYKIITLPLDLSKLSEEEIAAKKKKKMLEDKPKFYSDEDYLDESEESWDHSQYKDLFR
ncbi:PREDICTED: uncharacterized protein LOC100639415 [Amphimedon queenslandica]|uniref:Uncharacterized protein n=1 Tax=Amphimedon queenslandica TaxID=400682 RepID=A0A1X7U318_AMPQE|nr:PREDICTED: uncharacterized protein LOC100639415 [Amphimedon queenslandica]|eukprot:XP_003389185.1 PREDICTED: uncharacterized protein LOC100639415 [Amphimedon queenslandica]